MNKSNVTLLNVKRTEKALQAEFKGLVIKEGQSPLALLNEGDERFTQNSERHAWITVNAQSMARYFNVDEQKLHALKVGESIELNIESPEMNGVPFRIQIIESTLPASDYDVENWKTKAKQLKVDERIVASSRMSKTPAVQDALGEQAYFIKDGKLIFSEAKVVLQSVAPAHTFISDAVLHTEREATALVAANLSVAKKPEAVAATVEVGKEKEV